MLNEKKIQSLFDEYDSYTRKIIRTWTEEFVDEDTGERVSVECEDWDDAIPTPEQKRRMNDIKVFILANYKDLSNHMLWGAECRFDSEECFNELVSRNDANALDELGLRYECGKEDKGVYIDQNKALSLYRLAIELGADYAQEHYDELSHEMKNPVIDDGSGACNIEYHVRGKLPVLNNIVMTLTKITESLNGKNEPTEFGLYVPVGVIMKTLVNSDSYQGNMMEFALNDDELIIRAIIDEDCIEPFKYALLQSFDGVEIETVDLWDNEE